RCAYRECGGACPAGRCWHPQVGRSVDAGSTVLAAMTRTVTRLEGGAQPRSRSVLAAAAPGALAGLAVVGQVVVLGGGDGVATAQPAVEVDVGATRGAEGAPALDARLATDGAERKSV